MRGLIIAGAIGLMTAFPATAQMFEAENGVNVVGNSAGFTVQGGGGFGARGMWCAAGDYALRVSGAATAQRLFVANGSSGRNTAMFTLNAAELTPMSAALLGTSVSRPGSNLTVGHAISFCADHKLTRSNR